MGAPKHLEVAMENDKKTMKGPVDGNLYTYADYLTWDDDQRWELIDGVPYAMSSPSRIHQHVLSQLTAEFVMYLRGKKCQAYSAPFDVRIGEEEQADNEITTVVQPDLTVVCDNSKLDERGCKGTPDLVVEILSPSTGKHDKQRKYQLYQRIGVKEYWIVDPYNYLVEVFVLENGKFALGGIYSRDEELKVGIFDSLTISLENIFPE